MQLPTPDLYAIARSAQGLDTWKELQVTPLTRVMLDTISGFDLLRKLGPDVSAQVLAIPDPTKPPPSRSSKQIEVTIPDLPAAAHLSDKAAAAAEGVGKWLDDMLAWAEKRSPMTPQSFLLSGGLYAIGLAIARRALVHIKFPVFPHFYVLWVARTSVYRKTTGLTAISDLIRTAMPHMLFPQELTPEAFILTMSGNRPSNYDALGAYDKKLVEMSMLYPAQRGMLLDEASSLFAGAKKDYMAGSIEMLLRGFDAEPMYTRETKNDGRFVIRQMALSLLGATTPAAFNRTVDAVEWETGLTARFLMCYPDGRLPYSNAYLDLKDYAPPADVVKRLRKLYDALPTPEKVQGLESNEMAPTREALTAQVDKDVFKPLDKYEQALTYDLIWDGKLDQRLQGNYARLPVYTQKIMLGLAALDWAESGGKGSIRISLGHFARAQQITEVFRASSHRLLDGLNQSKESAEEDAIMGHLEKFPEGETLRDLQRRSGLPRKSIQEALDSLQQAGLVTTQQSTNDRGPKTTTYRIVEGNSQTVLPPLT